MITIWYLCYYTVSDTAVEMCLAMNLNMLVEILEIWCTLHTVMGLVPLVHLVVTLQVSLM